MGKKHSVPADLTIMKAMEYVGHQFRRGAGCRGGFCGACATVYRKKGSYKLQSALACQKIVEDGMIIAQIHSASGEEDYKINDLKAEANTFLEYYPEIARCLPAILARKRAHRTSWSWTTSRRRSVEMFPKQRS